MAFGIATLMKNLFGRGKEPFGSKRATNVVKFVILLHQTLDDYVTPFQVYNAVINPDQLRSTIAIGEIRFGAAKPQSSLRTQRNCNRSSNVVRREAR